MYGYVVFTGPETKVMKNMRPAPIKVSNVFKVVNQCIFLIFAAELCMMVISAFAFAAWNDANPDNAYLRADTDTSEYLY